MSTPKRKDLIEASLAAAHKRLKAAGKGKIASMALALALVALRAKRGLSQQDIADSFFGKRSPGHQKTISWWESGKLSPKLSVIVELAAAYKTTPVRLITLTLENMTKYD